MLRYLLSFAVWLFAFQLVTASQPQVEPDAGVLAECKVSEPKDLGLWDDLFTPSDRDELIVRRGEEFFSISMIGDSNPKKLCKLPAAANTRIFAGRVVAKRCWLMLNSTVAGPCAVDAFSGDVIPFEIPGLKIPGSQAPSIQSAVILPHTGGCILMVSSGDRDTWPRAGNHPVYFWMDLHTGKTLQFPLGWDINFFSADQSVAVFSTIQKNQFERRPLRAIDMKTGKTVDALADRRQEPYVYFHWQEKQNVQALYRHREGKGDSSFFEGLTIGGKVLPLALGLKEVQYLSQAKVRQGYAAFSLRNSGAVSGMPNPVWLAPWNDPQKLEKVDANVTDFTLIGEGNLIYVKQEPHNLGTETRFQTEAFLYQPRHKKTQNLLDGVDRLPPLQKPFLDKSYIGDQMTVRLIESFGANPKESLVLTHFVHARGDRRALVPFGEKPVEFVNWRRAILVDQNGQRCMTPLFRQGSFPDSVSLHNSGKLIEGAHVWKGPPENRVRQIRIAERSLERP